MLAKFGSSSTFFLVLALKFWHSFCNLSCNEGFNKHIRNSKDLE